jgi:hypothetical protein
MRKCTHERLLARCPECKPRKGYKHCICKAEIPDDWKQCPKCAHFDFIDNVLGTQQERHDRYVWVKEVNK